MANTEDLTQLRRSVDGLSGELRESQADRRRLHLSVRLLVGIVALLACTTGGSLFAAISANSASNDAKAASARVASVAHSNYETCLSNNQFRDDTRQLWAAVIATLQPLAASPVGRQFVAEIQHDVDVTTAPRMCRAA